MATNVNVAAISGNLTRDAELRMTQSGAAVLSFSVAVNDSVRDPQTGQYEDRASFIDCVMFGQRAQSVAPYLRKGTFVSAQGSLSWSQWQDRDTGKNRSKVEVRVREINFPQQMQPNRQAAQPQAYAPQQPAQPYRQPAAQPCSPQQPAPAYQPAAPQAYPGPAAQPAPATEVYDEDIPF